MYFRVFHHQASGYASYLLGDVAAKEAVEKKYGDYNWKGGLKFSRLIAACLRHVYLYLSGESLDSETGLSHIAHACCCLLMLLDFIISGRNSLDDRYKENKNETK